MYFFIEVLYPGYCCIEVKHTGYVFYWGIALCIFSILVSWSYCSSLDIVVLGCSTLDIVASGCSTLDIVVSGYRTLDIVVSGIWIFCIRV